MSENLNKHQQMARSGHYGGFESGGHVHMHEHAEKAGHSEVEHHHPKPHHGGHHEIPHGTKHSVHSGHDGKSIHHLHGGSMSHSEHLTESVGTDGGGKHPGGGGTAGTRNRL